MGMGLDMGMVVGQLFGDMRCRTIVVAVAAELGSAPIWSLIRRSSRHTKFSF